MKKNYLLWAVLLLLAAAVIFATCRTTGGGRDDTVTDGISIGDVVPGKGRLIWREEFEGDSLDRTKWNYDTGNGVHYHPDLLWWGNNEKQWFHEDNVRVADGKLIIEAKKREFGGMHYTSGKITTAGVKDPLFGKVTKRTFITGKTGYVEGRVKSPRGAGFWPNFYLLGANNMEYSGFRSVSWPRCGEVCIFEAKGHELDRVWQTIHYGTSYPARYWYKSNVTTVENIGDNYHIYGVGWDKSELRFYINGELTATINFPLPEEWEGANSATFYNGPGFAIQINLALGGYFLSPDANMVPDDSVLTSNDWEARSLMIDWIRVYQN